MTLPYLPQGESGGIVWQERFGGLNRRAGAAEGEIAAMENLCAQQAPLIASRPPRRRHRSFQSCGGVGAYNKLFWADGGQFYYDGVARGAVSEGEKRFYCLNRYIVIWPDKLFYNTATEEFGTLEAAVTPNCAVNFEPAYGGGADYINAPLAPAGEFDFRELFSAGEALHIEGAGGDFDRVAIVRAVGETSLEFDENTFPLPWRPEYQATDTLAAGSYWFSDGGGQGWGFGMDESVTAGQRLVFDDSAALAVMAVYDENDEILRTEVCLPMAWQEGMTKLTMLSQRESYSATGVTIRRRVPELEHLCQWNNRLWGVDGESVYASWLGNPKIWYNYDGSAACCWSVQVGSAGGFTGACCYGGYPLFFKEDSIARLYGTKPSNYQMMETQTLGCEKGCGKSFAVVGQTLYYKSRAGFVAYNGGVPRLIDDALGETAMHEVVAGTDGRRYYASGREGEAWSLMVYDAQQGLWHREDDSRAQDFAWLEGRIYMRRGEELWQLNAADGSEGEAESELCSFCEFADFSGSAGAKSAPRRLYLRIQSEGEVDVWLQYDGSGRWEQGARVCSARDGERQHCIELRPRRCERYRLRLEGRGAWRLWALGREYESGSRR